MLRESILASAELFAAKQYFLSDEFSLVDCSIAPVLWRLPVYGIELGSQAGPIEAYLKRVFERRSFQASLTELEQEMRL
jgi:RNA polymerase-associated protein